MGEGNGNLLAFVRRLWFPWLLKIWIPGLVIFAINVTSEDQIEGPSTGTLCISDCTTCPVICSPPPPPLLVPHPPPPPPVPSVHHSPPYAYSTHAPPPPLLVPFPPPPPLLVPYPPPPPPKSTSYSSRGPPPAPFLYFSNMPPSGQTPPTAGPRDYPYPYYYFGASKASSLPLDAASISMLLLFFHFVLSWGDDWIFRKIFGSLQLTIQKFFTVHKFQLIFIFLCNIPAIFRGKTLVFFKGLICIYLTSVI